MDKEKLLQRTREILRLARDTYVQVETTRRTFACSICNALIVDKLFAFLLKARWYFYNKKLDTFPFRVFLISFKRDIREAKNCNMCYDLTYVSRYDFFYTSHLDETYR